ncbi:MAG: ABC transporter ATP-binding protein [Deltaproteobacteria bacterium]|nr:ABC transporter ATP-binding protein [Deltaproteobacteria bacterium]
MITKRPLSYWVRTSSIRLQILLLAVIAVTVATRVLPLEMQKKIVNHAINLGQVDLLLTYCLYYLLAVVTASCLKFVINWIQTVLSQEALARMRKELYAHILTLPLSFFRRTSSGMVVSSLVTEVATASDFVGQAVAVPVTNGLTLLAFAAYMFYLNPLLATLSLTIYPLVLLVVPRLQRKSNEANKERVDSTRVLSSKISETVSGIHEVHGNGSYAIENRRYGTFVDELTRIRVTWNLYKQGVKVVNSFFLGLGPFVLFLIGGYLTIQGRFDLGAMVAFLSAYEKLYDPWKELMDFYQLYQDSSVSYKRLMEYFDVEPDHLLEPIDRKPLTFRGDIRIRDLSYSVAGGIQLLKQIDLELKAGEQLALIGFSGSGKSTLAQCIAQLVPYTGGSVQIDGAEVRDLTKKDMAQNLGIVAQSPYIFDGTIRENLIYSCRAILDESEGHLEERLPSLDRMIEVIQQVGLFGDILRFGLNTVLPRETHNKLRERIVRIRHHFQSGFGEQLAEDIEFFDEHRYLQHSSVATNLTFGEPHRPEYGPEVLHRNPAFLRFLDDVQLAKPLMSLGGELLHQSMDILRDLPPDEIFFQQTPIRSDEFEECKAVASRLEKVRVHELPEEDRSFLLQLALRFVPGVHRVVAMPPFLKNLILEGRHQFIKEIRDKSPHALSFYRMSEYMDSRTILDNILFGKPRTDHLRAQERISQSLVHLLIEEDLLETIVEIGMDFRVGTKGDRLSGGQRQKLAIARVFLKAPPVLIMDEATSALDNASQKRIQTLLETGWKGRSTLISVIHRLDTIRGYDRIAVMKAGKIMEMGSYQELMGRKGILYELIHGARENAQ